MSARRRSHTFVVTFLQADLAETHADSALRGRVRYVTGSEEITFTTADQLLAFFERCVQPESVAEAPKD